MTQRITPRARAAWPSLSLQWLLFPLLLFTGYKSCRDNAALGNRWLNLLGLHVARVWLAAWMAAVRRWFLRSCLAREKRREYAVNGFVQDVDFLPTEEFDRVRQEVLGSTWLLREMKQGNAITRKVFLDRAVLEESHPALSRLLSHPALLARLRYVAGVGGEPLFAIQAVVCEGGAQTDPQMVLHQDTFHSTAKAWFFLEDVADDGCPFAYVPGSHRLTWKRLGWEYRQSLSARRHPVLYHARGSFRVSVDELAALGLPPPRRFAVPANTLVVGDTYGFHARSPAARPAVRIEIYASLRRNPFMPWVGLDFFSLPLIRRYRGVWTMRLLALFACWGWMKMPWKSKGMGKILP